MKVLPRISAARYERLLAGARLADLAAASRVSIGALSQYERGTTPLSPKREEAVRRALERLKLKARAKERTA